jgi:hypothetical protein
MPRGWGARLALGLLLAAVAIAALQWWVGESEAREVVAAPRQDGPMLAAVALPRGSARRIVIAAASAALPEGCAPVIEIGRGGALRVPIPAPPPAGPLPEPWPVAGILLPRPALAALDPRERARLLEVIGAFVGAEPLAPDRLALAGVEARPGELDELARWLR